MPTLLEFEEPLAKLYEQLEKAEKIADDGDVDISKTVKDLKSKIKAKQQEIYADLSPWQRVQVSRHPERPYTLAYLNSITNNTTIQFIVY